MILSSFYSRVAVRPFPLTEEMKRIIETSSHSLYEKMDLRFFSDWDGTRVFNSTIDLKYLGRKINLEVIVNGGKKSGKDLKARSFFKLNETGDIINIELVLYVQLERRIKYLLKNEAFWWHFKSVLHHELIHLFDPKILDKRIRDLMPVYKMPTGEIESEWKNYLFHPEEVSAYEGSAYFYFVYSANKGKPFKQAIFDYINKDASRNEKKYIEFSKRDRKRWKSYLIVLYKSAEQAYRDVSESSDTNKNSEIRG